MLRARLLCGVLCRWASSPVVSCIVAAALLGSAARGEEDATGRPPEEATEDLPTEDRFEIRNLEGWTVYINRSVLREHAAETAETLEHLRWELYQIKLAAPPPAVTNMQEKNPIWIEYHEKVGLSYHPDRQWLLDRGYRIPGDPRSMMSLSVKTHVGDSYRHPFVIFHELAHGYDFHFTGKGRRYGNDDTQAAYERMMKEGKYENVKIWDGRNGSHYARSNRMEYWAETSEAYFAVNDIYPFVRAELREFDPEQARLLERYWGVDPERVRRAEADLAAYLDSREERSARPAAARESDSSAGYPRTESYQKRDVDGWTVYVSPQLVERPGLCEAMVTLLRYKLHMVDHFISDPGEEELHAIPLWLEAGGAKRYIRYCGSHRQIRREGLNPDKHRCVEVGDPQRMLEWALLQQSDVLHCLALAYYDRYATEGDSDLRARVRAAYDDAMKSGKYQSVLRFDGRRVSHPALRSEREYFAETMESYFLVNEHYPFLRCELKDQDPLGYEVIAGLWKGCPRR